MGKNHSMSRVERSRREKVTRYSVRKVSFGAASVAVAAFFMFLGNGAVYAAEPNVTATDSALAATPANNQLDENSGASDSTAPKAQADTTTPAPTDASSTSVESAPISKVQDETPAPTPVAESASVTPAPASSTEEVEEKATPDLDKKQLEEYVAKIDAKLASGSYATKTDESVATLKEHLELAKLALTTAKSQDELTKAYRRLFTTVNSGLRSKPKAQVESPKLDTTEGKATVGKKANNTEKATESNSIANSGKHDSRNGQALDRNNPFRTDGTTTDTDPAANQVYTAPEDSANVDDLATKLRALSTTVENEKKLATIDEIGKTKGIALGKIQEIDEFGGWTAITDSEGHGKFAVARKRAAGVFPLETVNTVKNGLYNYKTWTEETSFDNSSDYALFLSKVRTEKTKGEDTFDGAPYKSIGEGGDIAKGLKGFNGIEKTFKVYSPSIGSSAKISFKTGYTGDINGKKAKYRVELVGKKGGTETSLYSVEFDPSVSRQTQDMTVVAAKNGSSRAIDNSISSDSYDNITAKLEETTHRPNGQAGTFTSKEIDIPKGYTSYKVRISSADNMRLGMGYQVTWEHYALPITGLGFTVSQDTRKVAKDLLTKVYNKLKETEATDVRWRTDDSKAAYEEQLAKIQTLISGADNSRSTDDYKVALTEVLAKKTALVDEEKTVKDAAKQQVTEKLKEKLSEIETSTATTQEEKDIAKQAAQDEAQKAIDKIDNATDKTKANEARDAGVNQITPITPVAAVKPAARQAIEDAYTAKAAEIEKRPELTTEEKTAAKAEARKLAEAAKANVDKAKTNNRVDTVKASGVDEVDAYSPAGVEKDTAKKAVEAALKAQEKAIDAKADSTTEEKEAAKEDARAKAEAAKEAIDKADSNANVAAAKDAGVGTITPVEPKAEVKPAAKQAIEDAYTAKAAEIEKRPELTTEEKEAAKAEARKLADAAKANVDKAKTDDAVATAKESGTGKVEAVDPAGVEKDTAKKAVEAALKAQEKAIDAKADSTTEEKEAAKEDARAKAEAAKEAIDKADSNANVAAAKDAGVGTITPVEPKAEVKPAAKQAIEDAYTAKAAEIEKRPELTTEEKEAAKAEARKLADAAKANVDKAKTDDAVAAAEDKGTTKVADVDPAAKAKPAAKAAVDAALAEKDKAIDANDKLSDAEKSAAKEEAKKAADEAKKAIDAATDQAGVDAKATEGTDAVAAVNPVGKDKAKAAVDAALAEKDKAIDANDKLSDAEKSAAKEEAKKAADEAKKAIDAATDQAGVDAKEAEGKAEIAKVTPAPAVEVGKSAAKAEIEKAAKAKEAAIDANDKLSDAEKAAAKAQVAAEAKKAIEAIEKATTEAEVEAAKEAGKAEIAKVAPATTDYKAKAKAEVEAELAKKLAELENATDLTEAEKAAAKAQVVNKAKEAIEAIQKAATEADVDQAIRNFVYRISAVIREQEEYDLSKLFVNGSVTVKQGESLTDKDVLSKLNLPSGVEIVKVEKPTTSALGTVMAKVTVKLADGSVEEINVPVEVIVSQNHGNEGNGANNGANNTEAKVNKAKLEGAIHQLDELIIKESAKLDAETAKEANALSADAKKVFANADASQAEVDAMVKRIEDFMAKVAPSTNHANTANDQSAQTPAVAPATTQAAANASQTVSAQANARKAAKELPNTGTVNSTVAMVAAAASALLGLGLAGRRRKEDEEA